MRVRLLTWILVLIIISVSAHAFGIGYPYLKNDTLELYPGQNHLFKVEVQNKNGEDVTAEVSVNSTIASLVGKPRIDVPQNSFDKYFYINITAPRDAKINQTYEINYVVTPVGREEGQIPLAVRYARGFTVKIIPKPEGIEEEEPQPKKQKKIPVWIYMPIIIIIIIIILVFIWKKSSQMTGRITKPRKKQPPIHIPMKKASKPRKTEKKAVPKAEHPFKFREGKTINTLSELHTALKHMSQQEFSHYVTPNKNDFATWTAHSLKNQELANKMFKTASQQEIISLIKNELFE